MSSTCETCKFWRFGYLLPDKDVRDYVGFGACRRRSPVATGGMMSPMETIWPATSKNDFCGEHQPKDNPNEK